MEAGLSDFREAWRRLRPGLYPIGHLLRRDQAPYWLRFHSLPESKRYAETEAEQQILLSRQNAIAADVLGEDQACWLVQSHWVTRAGQIDVADAKDPFRATRDYGLQFAFQFAEDEDDPEASRWNVHAIETRWTTGAFDDLLLSIADYSAGPTLWVDSAAGNVFAPYDGGIDLFLRDTREVASLAAAHLEWLSSHPQGL